MPLFVFLIGLGIIFPVYAGEYECRYETVTTIGKPPGCFCWGSNATVVVSNTEMRSEPGESRESDATIITLSLSEPTKADCGFKGFTEPNTYFSNATYTCIDPKCGEKYGVSEYSIVYFRPLIEQTFDSFHPDNKPPDARFMLPPFGGAAPLSITVDGTESKDPDGSITGYEWVTTNDKVVYGSHITPFYGPTASFVFEEGIHWITLTVGDNEGLFSTISHAIIVAPEIQVTKITSKYQDGTHFMDGIDHDLTYTAEIDWFGEEPGTVSFITPKITKDVNAKGNTAEQTFNMGKDFGVCGKLKVVATSKDGKKSAEKEADFTVTSKPFLNSGFVRVGEDTGEFSYSFASGGVNWEVFDLLAEAAGDFKDPVLSKIIFKLKFIPTISVEVNNKGETEVALDWENFNLSGEKEFKVGNFGAELHPTINVNGEFQDCEWKWDGDVSISGSAEFGVTEPFGVPVGPVIVPMYIKAIFSVDAKGKLLAIKNVEPFTPGDGQVALSPTAKGSLGVGVSDIVAVEGWMQAGGELEWKLPPLQLTKPTKGAIVNKIGVTVVALSWKWEGEALNCEWDYVADKGKCSSPFIRSHHVINPILVERDYLANPNHNTFRKSTRGLRDSDPVSLQLAVYPYSDTDLSGNNNILYATWLSDNPARSAINRTQVVFTTWNGANWTDPQPIAEDGTADFHPKILALSDNSALVTWEDTQQVLADTAQFEDSVKNLEISVAHYNAQTQHWQTQRLTTNAYLDRSPKLAGINGNAMVTWVSNEANDLMGSATHPNKVWFAQYLNNQWNIPKQMIDLPYPLLKYNVAYNGQTGYAVFSVDTDGDVTTIEDHELFQTTFNNGVWSILTPLTTDTVADDNPQLGFDPMGNIVLTWLKESELSSAINFDVNNRVIIRKDETGYSSNLADFKLARSNDGKLAIVWAEPTQDHNSDLFALFYDPAYNTWGGLRQLTSDNETEKRVAVTFYDPNTLIALYNRDQLGESTASLSSGNQAVQIGTDLYMLKHSIRAIDLTTIDLPDLGKGFILSPQGNRTDANARFAGGALVGNDGQALQEQTLSLSQPVTINAVITPLPEHVGQPADIVGVGYYVKEGFLKTNNPSAENCDPTLVDSVTKGGYYMMKQRNDQYCSWIVQGSEADKNWCVSQANKDTVVRNRPETPSDYFSLWDGNLQNLKAIDQVTLTDPQLLSSETNKMLYQGQFDAPGHICFYFGYKLADGMLVFNGEKTINLRVIP